MKNFVCEECGKVFKSENKSLFSPECPKCGCYDTTEVGSAVDKLTEYEASQEQ